VLARVCASGLIEKAVEKAKSLAGTVMKDKTDVMGRGSLAIINDPTGAMFGLWETQEVLIV
jgi:uncharacterized protein